MKPADELSQFRGFGPVRQPVGRISASGCSAVELKPNGQPFGTFLITIDDGYAAYKYKLRPRSKGWSIHAIYTTIRKAFRVREEQGTIQKPNPGVHPSPDASAGVGGATRCSAPLDAFRYHECIDRTATVLDHFHEYVSTHPVPQKHKKLMRACTQAEKAMAAVYRIASDISDRPNWALHRHPEARKG